MACAEAGAGVCVEELVEPKIFAPIGIEIELIATSIACSSPVIAAGEDMLKTVLELLGDMTKVHIFSRTLGAFNSEGVTIEHIEAQEGLDKQEVHAEPNGLEDTR
jgi:hypothetical protein